MKGGKGVHKLQARQPRNHQPYFLLFDDLNMTDTAVRKRHAGSLQPMKSTELQEEDDLKKVISSKTESPCFHLCI